VLPSTLSTNDLDKALASGLWNSQKTAIAVSFTNSTSAWVFLKQGEGGYLPIDVSHAGLGLGIIGTAGRAAYERLELMPIRWLDRDDGMFMVLMRTRAWKAGQRHTVSKPVLIRKDGTVLQQ
jgi:hypothetical protein